MARPVIQDFINSGSWVAPGGVFVVELDGFGGGGQGGGGGSPPNVTINNQGLGGGGGGSSVYNSVKVPVVPGTTYNITIGAGGTGGGTGGTPGGSGVIGGVGGDTIFTDGANLTVTFRGAGPGKGGNFIASATTQVTILGGGPVSPQNNNQDNLSISINPQTFDFSGVDASDRYPYPRLAGSGGVGGAASFTGGEGRTVHGKGSQASVLVTTTGASGAGGAAGGFGAPSGSNLPGGFGGGGAAGPGGAGGAGGTGSSGSAGVASAGGAGTAAGVNTGAGGGGGGGGGSGATTSGNGGAGAAGGSGRLRLTSFG